MIKRIFVLLACIFLGAVPLSAQSSKLIKELESKRGELQKQIADTESLLKNTKKDVGSQLNSLALLTGQIEERKRYILAINNDVEALERELNALERQLRTLQRDLQDKKKKYESSVQYLYRNKSVEEKLIETEDETSQKHTVAHLLNTLSPRQREIIYYRFFEGLDYSAICELMGLNYQSAYNLLQRSLSRLREMYGILPFFFLF